MLPSPLWGGVGGGGRCWWTRLGATTTTPTPTASASLRRSTLPTRGRVGWGASHGARRPSAWSLERDLSEHLLAQDLSNERVDRPGARHVHEWPPRIDAVVDPWWSPVARRPHEVLGEVGLLCPRIRRLDFQATVEAHIHVRLQLPANTTVVALVPRLGTSVCDDPCDIAPARRARPIVSLRLIPPGVWPTLARTQSMRGAQSWKAPSCSSYFSLRC